MPDYQIPPARYWRKIPVYYRLEATRCLKCGQVYYPPRARCRCGSTELARIKLTDPEATYTLEEFTVLNSVSVEFEKQKPLVFGLVKVKLQDMELKVLSQLTDVIDSSELSPGKLLEPVFRVVKRDGQIGLICYGTKFRLKLG